MLAQLRLMQLLSPVLPVGSYSYSQGLEWAVKQGWVVNREDLDQWLNELIKGSLAQQDLPLLRNLYQAFLNDDVQRISYWSHVAVALRDTAELRAEERARAQAFLRVLEALPDDRPDAKIALYKDSLQQTPFAAMAWASVRWEIDELPLLYTFAYNWLDAAIVNGVKIIPLGQSDGQVLLHTKLPALQKAVETSLDVADDAIGFSVPSVSMASCNHEVQYSRIYRS